MQVMSVADLMNELHQYIVLAFTLGASVVGLPVADFFPEFLSS